MAETIELKVDGMTCDHCVRAVTEAISGVDGVTERERRSRRRGGDRSRARALTSEAVVAAIVEEGYEAAPQAAS